MKVGRFLGALFNPWVLIGGLAISVALFAATLLLLNGSRPGPAPAEPGTAVVNIIAAPLETPTPPSAAPALTPPPTEQVDGLLVGGYVEVAGTGGDGLRLRFTPGLESKVRLLGAEGEVYEVVDGPQQADGYTWWYLEDPDERSRRGWAVTDFLQPASPP